MSGTDTEPGIQFRLGANSWNPPSAVYLRTTVLSLRKQATPTSASVRSKVTLFLRTAQLAGQILRSRKSLSLSLSRKADAGAADDMFVVYQGHVDRPLDQPAV